MSKARDIARAGTALSSVDATELGYLDGVTSNVQTQINAKLATATAASTYQPLVANVSDTEIGYLDGVTSAIQTQLNQKPEYAAGKNKIINGDFGIWQRGTSFTYTGYSPSYTADRFYYQTDATGGSPSYTVSQQTFTPGAAPVAGYEGTYYLRLACTTKGTTVSYSLFKSPIEDVRTLAGQTVTLSFWAKASSSTSFKTTCEQNFGSGGSAQVSEIGATNYTLTTSWVRYSTTFTMTSVSGKTIGTGSNLTVVLNSTAPVNGLNVDIWGVQLEAGSVATAFQTATGTIQGELAACQRYYEKSYNVDVAPATATASGWTLLGIGNASNTIASGQRYGTVFFKVTKRGAPTVTVRPYTTPANTSRVSNVDGTDLGASSGAISGTPQTNYFQIQNDTGGTVTTTGYCVIFHWEASAEL